jgi:hypothetical protein
VVLLGIVGGELRPSAFGLVLASLCALQVAADVIEHALSVREVAPMSEPASEAVVAAAGPDDAHAI